MNRKVQGLSGMVSQKHCIYSEIIQEIVWKSAKFHYYEKKYIFLKNSRSGGRGGGSLKYDLTSRMDTFDGENELDEMKFKKERHFECVCVCSICGQLNLSFSDSLPSPNLVLISFVVFFVIKMPPS